MFGTASMAWVTKVFAITEKGNTMTYDVLEKVGKKELIAWMRKNVFLPRISDEQFLKDVKLIRLFAEEEELLNKDRALIEKLESAKDNHIEFMKLMIESEKLNQQLDKLSKQINKCMGLE
jgi:hypothetical protein